MAMEPAHVRPLPQPGFARRRAASCPLNRCLAPAEQRDGSGAHTRGTQACAGLRSAGGGIMPSPPLHGTSQAAQRPWRPTHVGPRPKQGFARRGAESCPPLRCQAMAKQRELDGGGAHTHVSPAQAGLRPAGSGVMPSPLLHSNAMAMAPTHVVSLPKPGFARQGAASCPPRCCCGAARYQPSCAVAVAPTHVGPQPKPGFARLEAASCRLLCCVAQARQRDGRVAPSCGAPAQAGLRPAGGGPMPPPPLPGTSRAA